MKLDINIFTGNLFNTVSECLDILSLLDEVEEYTKTMPPIQKARMQKYLIELLVTKLYTLFDNDKNVISFERLYHEYLSEDTKVKYLEVKKPFTAMIKRIQNNRLKIAHNPKNNNLGFSKQELEEFEKIAGVKMPLLPQPYEQQHIQYRSLPRDGMIVLLQELKYFLLYDVLYPNVQKPVIPLLKGE